MTYIIPLFGLCQTHDTHSGFCTRRCVRTGADPGRGAASNPPPPFGVCFHYRHTENRKRNTSACCFDRWGGGLFFRGEVPDCPPWLRPCVTSEYKLSRHVHKHFPKVSPLSTHARTHTHVHSALIVNLYKGLYVVNNKNSSQSHKMRQNFTGSVQLLGDCVRAHARRDQGPQIPRDPNFAIENSFCFTFRTLHAICKIFAPDPARSEGEEMQIYDTRKALTLFSQLGVTADRM